MTTGEVTNRLVEWCEIDSKFAEFLRTCNRRYWMYDDEYVLGLIAKKFSEVPMGVRVRIADIVNETFGFEELRRVGSGWVYIFEKYFIDGEDLRVIERFICEYAKGIHRYMDVPEAYGYPPNSHPKLGMLYNLYFIMKERH